MDDLFDDIIRSSFGNEEDTSGAPEFNWDLFDSHKTEDSLTSLIINSFESQIEKAPESVWDKIQDQLDIDNAWQKIGVSISFNRYSYFNKVALVLILISLPFSLDKAFNLNTLLDYNKKSQIAVVKTSPAIPKEKLITPKKHSIINDAKNSSTFQSTPLKDETFEFVHGKSDQPLMNSNITPDDSEFYSIKLNTLSLKRMSNNFTSLDILPKRSINQIKKAFSIGIAASLDYTSLVDNDHRRGRLSESTVENIFETGENLGVFVEYFPKENITVLGAIDFVSRLREKNNYFSEKGEFLTYNRVIDQQKLSILIGYQSMPKYSFVAHSSVARLGAYVSRINNDITLVNGNIQALNSSYSRYDIGLKAEIGKKLFFNKFQLESGLKGDFGLSNLANLHKNISPQFNRTRSISVGVFARASYKL